MTPPYVRHLPFVAGVRTYRGSCACRAVRYEIDLDLSKGSSRCNCSVCAKTGSWGAIAKPGALRVLAGEDALGDYCVTEAGHARFCKRCGVRTFGHGNIPEIGGEYVSVNLHTLDEAPLAGVPTVYIDGRADTWAVLNAMPYADPFNMAGKTVTADAA